MKFKIPFGGADNELNMAPMIDMVFLLLIFFMVTSHLSSLERVPVLLPVASEAHVPKEARNRQMISLVAEGEDGRQVRVFFNLQEMGLEEFKAELLQLSNGDQAIQLYLRADRRVLHRHIRQVLEVCAEAGIVDVIFGTFESGS